MRTKLVPVILGIACVAALLAPVPWGRIDQPRGKNSDSTDGMVPADTQEAAEDSKGGFQASLPLIQSWAAAARAIDPRETRLIVSFDSSFCVDCLMDWLSHEGALWERIERAGV